MIPIVVNAPASGRFARTGEPVRLGVPVAAGRLMATDQLALRDGAGRPQPLQARALDRWNDASIRWVLLDFLADHHGTAHSTAYTLELRAPGDGHPEGSAVVVQAGADACAIETGPLALDLATAGSHLFRRVLSGGIPSIDPARTRLTIDSADGPMPVVIDRLEVEDAGPIRAIVRLEGTARAATRLLNVSIRLHAFAGSADVRLDITLHNPAGASHPGNFWELGEPGSVIIREASLRVAFPPDSPPPTFSCSTAGDAPLAPCGPAFELWQASSGGANWSSANHVDRHGQVTLPFKGYKLTQSEPGAGGPVMEGDRATPVAVGQAGAAALAVAVPHFWQNFPKTLEGSADGLTVGLFPRQHAGGHELQPGEQKTHVVYVSFAVSAAARALQWTRAPLFVHATPAHYTGSGALGYILPLADDPNHDYAALVQSALDADDSFERKRELIDEYGWRHFGDIYADHERVYYKGPPPVHSHYNNQYDALAGMARQFVRSADPRWWQQFCELATHVIDIDLYRTVEDKSAYNHGLFWHTGHYVDAGRSTHRSHPRAAGVSGGGPSSEHNYTTGLLLYYYLTGEPAGRDAVVMLARWVVDMDDGTRSIFRRLARGDTGLASATYEATYQGPGRGAGHSIAALIDGYRLTGEAFYLDKAEALIRRCIHPADDISERRLLDIERRWSYTIFLHVLGRYLDEKALLGQIDGAYAYARQSLLAYATWMRAHEQPYFERLVELEYPTETWVAQELWKSEVFTYAARYTAAASERAAFLERADFFFRYAIDALGQSPTRTLTRPLVLLLSRGLMHGYMSRHPEALAAPLGPAVSLGPLPRRFVPQRVQAVRNLAMLTVVMGAAFGAAVIWLLS